MEETYTKDTNIFVQPVAGDTDSVAGDMIVETNIGRMTFEELFRLCSDESNFIGISSHGAELYKCPYEVLNWTDGKGLHFTKVNIIARHKVSKDKWELKTFMSNVIVTGDHSLMTAYKCTELKEVKPSDVDTYYDCAIVQYAPGETTFDDIDYCKKIGTFNNEYVYDLEVEDMSHTFFANDVLVHNSIYFCYEGLLNTIEGVENMSITEKARIIEQLNTQFLNQHNKEIMTEYYRGRHTRNVDTDMIHEFELETIAYSEIRLDVKKRYSQMLIWKDGKYFDEDHLKQKSKGLETIKSSYPAPARKILNGLVKTLLLSEDENIIHILNNEMQRGKEEWMALDIESISPAISVNGYTKYIKSDNDPRTGVQEEKGCPFAVRGLAYYNWLRQTKGLLGDPLYGGKMKYYIVKSQNTRKKSDKDVIFTFQPSALPKWAEQYAPCDRLALFQKCVLDPFNRILSAIGEKQLRADGYIETSLFDL